MTNTELTKIRESLHLTKSEFAKALGITPMMVGRCEKGSCAISDEVAKKVEALVTVEPASVVEEKTEEKPAPKKRGRKKKEVAAPVVDEISTPAPVEKPAEEQSAPKKRGRKKATAPDVTVEAAADEKPAPKKVRTRKKTTTPEVIVESLMGGQISVTDILSRLPEGAEKVYIKPEENKAFFTINDEAQSIELWT